MKLADELGYGERSRSGQLFMQNVETRSTFEDEGARQPYSDASPFAFTREFWAHFAAHHWERAPLVLKQPFATHLTSPGELFDILVQSSDQYRAQGRSMIPSYERPIKMRFCIEHAVLMADIESHLPESADESIENYARRIERRLEGREFELIVNQLQSHSFAMWSRLRDFLRGLYEFVGIPTENADAAIFLRKQRQTGFGLHRDKASVFVFVLRGRKRILLWPHETFRDRENIVGTLDYREFTSDATILEGEPGDILYWPSTYWHIGESEDELSASISLGLRLNYPPFADVVKHATHMVERQLGAAGRASLYPFAPGRLQQTAEAVPDEIETAIRALQEASHDPNLEQTLKLSWLNRVTGYGFTSVPAPRPVRKLADDASILGRPDYPVVCVPLDENRFACSANGHSFTVSDLPALPRLIDRLNAGHACPVGSLLDEFANEFVVEVDTNAREFLRKVLEKLYGLRAIDLINSKEN